MTLYDDLLKKNADAHATLKVFTEQGRAFVQTLADALREHLGCTAENLRVRRPGPGVPEIPDARNGEQIGAGITLTSEGIEWTLSIAPNSHQEWLVPCILRPLNGARFVAMVGADSMEVAASDRVTIQRWCSAAHASFERNAARTDPFDISAAEPPDMRVGGVRNKPPRAAL